MPNSNPDRLSGPPFFKEINTHLLVAHTPSEPYWHCLHCRYRTKNPANANLFPCPAPPETV